jgi:hypothetical protein
MLSSLRRGLEDEPLVRVQRREVLEVGLLGDLVGVSKLIASTRSSAK